MSFPPLDRDTETPSPSRDFSVLLVGVAARQAASPTATLSFRAESAGDAHATPLIPLGGAFNRSVAADLKRRKEPLSGQPDK